MPEIVKEVSTGRGKKYKLSFRPWQTQNPMWRCLIIATPISQNLSGDQNIKIRVRLSRLLLAELNMETEIPPEEFADVLELSVQLILEKDMSLGEVQLLLEDKGLILESLGGNELLVSWTQDPFSKPMIVNCLKEAVANSREQQQRIGFH